MEINSKNAQLWSRFGSRAVFGQAMLAAGEKNEKIMALSGDLGNSSGLARFQQTFPERYLNVGIAGQTTVILGIDLITAASSMP